ncbi:MAG: hypothetical protein ACK5PR_00105, partial [bacterium]
MSGSNDGYQEIDLDNLGKPAEGATASDIEIIDETQAPQDIEVVQETTPAPAPAATADSDPDEDESGADPATGERKRTTRSQRLKNQRDEYARQLAAAQAELQSEREARRRFEADATEGAVIGYDLLVKQIDTEMKALRFKFDQAFDSGDRERIFEVQQEMALLAAKKSQAERDRQSIPTKPVQQSGPAAPQQTQPTQPARPKPQPSPLVQEWYGRHKDWFGKDPVMTAAASALDQQLASEGYRGDDPDYFDELDRRLEAAFPHKFGRQPAATQRPTASPTIQTRSPPAAAPGKIRVTITQADRDMANQFGITVEEYARQKARIEASQRTATQYT